MTVTITDATPNHVPVFELTVDDNDRDIGEGDTATYTITADRTSTEPPKSATDQRGDRR